MSKFLCAMFLIFAPLSYAAQPGILVEFEGGIVENVRSDKPVSMSMGKSLVSALRGVYEGTGVLRYKKVPSFKTGPRGKFRLWAKSSEFRENSEVPGHPYVRIRAVFQKDTTVEYDGEASRNRTREFGPEAIFMVENRRWNGQDPAFTLISCESIQGGTGWKYAKIGTTYSISDAIVRDFVPEYSPTGRHQVFRNRRGDVDSGASSDIQGSVAQTSLDRRGAVRRSSDSGISEGQVSSDPTSLDRPGAIPRGADSGLSEGNAEEHVYDDLDSLGDAYDAVLDHRRGDWRSPAGTAVFHGSDDRQRSRSLPDVPPLPPARRDSGSSVGSTASAGPFLSSDYQHVVDGQMLPRTSETAGGSGGLSSLEPLRRRIDAHRRAVATSPGDKVPGRSPSPGVPFQARLRRENYNFIKDCCMQFNCAPEQVVNGVFYCYRADVEADDHFPGVVDDDGLPGRVGQPGVGSDARAILNEDDIYVEPKAGGRRTPEDPFYDGMPPRVGRRAPRPHLSGGHSNAYDGVPPGIGARAAEAAGVPADHEYAYTYDGVPPRSGNAVAIHGAGDYATADALVAEDTDPRKPTAVSGGVGDYANYYDRHYETIDRAAVSDDASATPLASRLPVKSQHQVGGEHRPGVAVSGDASALPASKIPVGGDEDGDYDALPHERYQRRLAEAQAIVPFQPPTLPKKKGRRGTGANKLGGKTVSGDVTEQLALTSRTGVDEKTGSGFSDNPDAMFF